LASVSTSDLIHSTRAEAQNFTFIPGNGNWSVPGAWEEGGYPNGSSHTAIFPTPASPNLVSLDSRFYTLNTLIFQGGGSGSNHYGFSDGGLYFVGASPRIEYGSAATSGYATGEFLNSVTLELQSTTTFNGTAGDALLWASSPISGVGGLIKTGPGRLVLAGANTYTGGTSIEGGTLQVSGTGTLPSGGNLSISSGATLDVSQASADQTIGALTGASGSTISLGARRLTAGTADSMTFAGTIGGTGGLTKEGTGTLILSGDNSYSGATTINAGTLQIGNGGTTGTLGSGAVVNNGTLTFYRSADLTAANTISGSGRLTKTGTGTLTLTGDASGFTGEAEVGAGTLAITSGAQFASGNGTIESDGSDPGGVATVRVSGAGSAWSGNLIFVGRNNEAALVIEDGGRVESDAGIVASDNYGSLGTVTVTGDNSQWNAGAVLSVGHYGHGTVLVAERGGIESDIVVIGGGNASASGDVTVSGAGSELAAHISSPSFDDSSIVVGYYGTGKLTVTDGGRVAAPNGSILLASQASAFGTLNIGAASGALPRAAGMVDVPTIIFGAGNGSLVFNHTGNPDGSDLVFSPAISGSGSILHENGNTKLTGDSSGFSGTTAVSGGRLSVNGTLGGTMQVRNGGTLGGSGTIGAGAGSLVTVASGGTVAPGNLSGTLNVAGSVTFAPGSVYQVEVNAAGQSDRIAATGSAAITGGTVQVLAESGSYRPSTTYTILTATGGRSGAFSGVTSNFAFLTPTLGYDVNAVTLTLSRKVEPQPPAPPTPDNPTPPAPTPVAFHSVAVTPNQYTTADGVEALGSGNPLFDVVLGQSVAGARQAFDALSGEAHASAATVAYGDSSLVRDAILRRLRQPLGSSLPTFAQGNYTADRPGAAAQPVAVPVAPSPVYSLWGEGFGSWGRIGHNSNAAGLDTSTGGFILGADAQVSDAFRIGLAGGFTRTTWDVDGRLSSGSTDSIYAALYGSGSWGGLTLRLGGFYAWHDFDVSRTVTFPGFFHRTYASYDGWTAQAFGELGYQVSLGGGVTLEPFLGASVMRLHMDGFQEEGGAAALTSHGRSYELGTTTLGLRAEARLGLDLPLTVRGMVGWRHAYGDVNPSALLAFFSGASAFNVAGIPIDRDALVAEAGLDWQVNKTMTLGVSYTGQIGERAQAHAVKGNFSWRFETW
jgi:outer membrane autotransporter protein